MIELNDRDRTVIVKVKNINSFYLKPLRQRTRWEITDDEQNGITPIPPTYQIELDISQTDTLQLHYQSEESRQIDYDLILNSLRGML